MSLGWFPALIKTMRLKQWAKNLLLFIPLIFDQQLTNWLAVLRVLSAFIIFCLLASVVYIINDLADMEADRQHPKKRLRPIPSGNLQPRTALAAAIVLLVVVAVGAISLSVWFALICLTYFLLNIAYSKWLKHIPILDVMILASFYVLRIVAGVVVIVVSRFSPWLYVFTTFMALYLGIGKRRAELALLADSANSHRKVLEGYTIPLLDQLTIIVSSSAIITYSLYTFSAPNVPANHTLMLTIPFVIFGVFRYLYLVQVEQRGGAPEEVLFSDRPLQVCIVLWGLVVLIVFYLIPRWSDIWTALNL